MIAEEIYDLVLDDLFIRVDQLAPGNSVLLKLEGLNPAGSVKLKTAVALVARAEETGRAFPRTRLIESTSGNLGVALAMVCAAKGYPLTCVTDPNANAPSVRLMKALGAEVVVIDVRDGNGGYLQSRINYIHERLAREPDTYWLNQYANPAGPRAHHDRTGRSIFEEIGHVDYVFIGAGTTGTLMGCAEFFRRHSPATRIVAVDAVGSVTFGGPPGRRHIPGLGTSRRPEILDAGKVDEVVLVPEADAVEMCRSLAESRGLLLGGSSGTVLSAVKGMAGEFPPGSVVVALSPDSGDRYLETVYDDSWVAARWPWLVYEEFPEISRAGA
ncbi:2,3-diaminopropionate biosynthesis protein SbnA [Streptomyces sp. LP05-1]|uniref:2,3-diaminopropionate biosynthesis protein SbnA n=1 Tax=Streptomyces pyxinae TaxID=2970734 RepID=A0ABT2CM59_9ACTN|nr:2,3-diaminopropionate biosynthesis protein SbnA [Streptomyces sp. LP05-1]MCS0638177.1 2,3-diaminopropionate biosynthesis protein SbnA [Streptomyces sp. LP05-1]